jgi:hypothetical protein
MDESCIPRETEGETAQGAGGTNRKILMGFVERVKMLYIFYKRVHSLSCRKLQQRRMCWVYILYFLLRMNLSALMQQQTHDMVIGFNIFKCGSLLSVKF